MAKNKHSKEKTAPASKKKDNTLLYGLAVLILIVIIVLVVRSGKQSPADIDVKPTQPTDKPVETQPPAEKLPAGVTEMMDCSAGAAIGFKACNMLGNGDVELVVYHSVSTAFTPLTLTGAQYYLYDENGQKLAEASQMGQVQPGQEAKYVLPVSGTSGTTKVEVRPVINDGGVDKICVNQRVIVIPANSCK